MTHTESLNMNNIWLNIAFVVACVFAQASCEWLQYGGKVYYFSHHDRDAKTFNDAENACNEQHGGSRLVLINSQAENRFLALNGGTNNQLWIGLVCKRVSCSVDELWWPDDSTISYYKGPDEIAGGNALALNTANGGWPAYATEDTHFYICERVDTCLSSPCLNGGTCLLNNATGNYSCEW